MTRRWYVQAALVAAMGLGVASGAALAQTPQPAVPQTAPAPPAVADPTPWGIIDFGSKPVQHLVPEPVTSRAVPQARRSLVDYLRGGLNKHGLACYSHHNAFLCSSWHSEKTFIFGSCREFFGEPCLPNPPKPPLTQRFLGDCTKCK